MTILLSPTMEVRRGAYDWLKVSSVDPLTPCSTVNPDGSENDVPLGFITPRSHWPSAAPVKLNTASIVVPSDETLTKLPGMSGWPVMVRLGWAPALNPVPLICKVTVPELPPLVGSTPNSIAFPAPPAL